MPVSLLASIGMNAFVCVHVIVIAASAVPGSTYHMLLQSELLGTHGVYWLCDLNSIHLKHGCMMCALLLFSPGIDVSPKTQISKTELEQIAHGAVRAVNEELGSLSGDELAITPTRRPRSLARTGSTRQRR